MTHVQRAEHNEYMLSTLEEVALHQQNIEAIELIGHMCPRLRILYLQNNLIGKVQNLHKLKVCGLHILGRQKQLMCCMYGAVLTSAGSLHVAACSWGGHTCWADHT